MDATGLEEEDVSMLKELLMAIGASSVAQVAGGHLLSR
jgi:hypothetical protein